MDGTRIPRLYSSLDKGKEEESADANGLELSLRPPGDRKYFTGSHQKRYFFGKDFRSRIMEEALQSVLLNLLQNLSPSWKLR